MRLWLEVYNCGQLRNRLGTTALSGHDPSELSISTDLSLSLSKGGKVTDSQEDMTDGQVVTSYCGN